MGMVITPESEYGKELAKWNKPYVYERYPAMLYKAIRMDDDGQIVVRGTEKINRQCQLVVHNEAEQSKAMEAGWRTNPVEAVEYLKSRDKQISTAAAHRNYEDRNMSEAARAEAEAYEGDSPEHVAEIPEKPKKRRARLKDED